VKAAPDASKPRPGFFELELLDNRYPALHGLRVVAILTVIQFHVTWIFGFEQGLRLDPTFSARSLTVFFGMDLFFMLSGFLIGSILLRSLEVSGTQQLRRFYLRRIFRTFPSYYLVLTLLVLAFPLTATQLANVKWEYVYGTNFLDLNREHVVMFWGWSLALEEQFYLTVPALFWVLHRLKSDRARVGLLLALWVAALGVRLGLYLHGRPWDDLSLYGAIYFRTYTRFDTLIAGILLAFVHLRWRAPLTAWLKDPFHRALLAVPALACTWLLLEPWTFGPDTVQLVHVFAWGSITTAMYFAYLVLLLHGDGAISRALSHPIFQRIATLGYGVYLVHIPLCDHLIVPAARWLDSRHVPMWVIWPAALASLSVLSVAVAYLLHVFVEKPSLRLREWLAA
jgi:peptidoglycan/LPS O-acetylase OafA/YrhL